MRGFLSLLRTGGVVFTLAFAQLAWAAPTVPTGIDEGIWFDAETLRYLLEPAREWAGDRFDPLLDRTEGVRLTRVGDATQVEAHFDASFTVEIAPESEVANWELYAIEVPQMLRFQFTVVEGVLRVTGLDDAEHGLVLLAKLPWLPNRVRLRNSTADFETGEVRVEGGVLRNRVAVIAEGQLMERSYDGVDFWESIRRNFRFLRWPKKFYRE